MNVAGTCWNTARAYTSFVPETAGHRIGVRETKWRTTAAARFFYVRTPSRAFNGRDLAGVPSGTPVSISPVRQPCHVPGHPNWRWGPGSQTRNGGRTMRHALARPEQLQSPLEIIRAALRDAAIAPTVFDALNVTSDALRRLAEIVRAEVQQ